MTVGIALITQMGEQADYLRFMPKPAAATRRSARWWLAVFHRRAGLGDSWAWLKMLGGALLAYLAIEPDGAAGPGGGPEPDVPRRLRHRLLAARPRRWRPRPCW